MIEKYLTNKFLHSDAVYRGERSIYHIGNFINNEGQRGDLVVTKQKDKFRVWFVMGYFSKASELFDRYNMARIMADYGYQRAANSIFTETYINKNEFTQELKRRISGYNNRRDVFCEG